MRSRRPGLMAMMLVVALRVGEAAGQDAGKTTATARFDPHLIMETARGTGFGDGRERSLEISGQFQFRAMLNSRDQTRREDVAWGFELRRAKVKAKGRLMGDDLRYTFSVAFNRKTGVGVVEDLNIEARLWDGFKLKAGQFRPSLLREESVSSKRQLTVERSLIAKAFTQARVRGVALTHQTDRTRWSAALMDASTSLVGSQSWEAIARGEVLVLGKWKRLKDFTSFPDDKPAVMIGASVGLIDTDPRVAGTPSTRTLRWTVDVSAESGGANLFAAFVGNRVDTSPGPTLDQYGLVVQGGAFVSDTTEVFARYEMGDADNGSPMLSLVTVGATEYIREHDLKVTVDVGFALDEVSGFWSSSGAAWLTDEAGRNGQVLMRAQVQLLF